MRRFFACSSLCILLCGCSILQREPYKPVNYYDLSYPDARIDLKGAAVSIGEINADRPYGDRMVFRVSENRIEIDEFNRWACNPADMLNKYLSMAFEPDPAAKPAKYSVSLQILLIEASLDKPAARVAILATFSDKAKGDVVLRKIYRQEMPLEKVTGDDFAKAAGGQIAKIAQDIAQDVMKLK